MRSGHREGCQKCLRPTLPHTSSHLFRQGMHLHKHRLDGAGRPVGKAEYVTPQSQHVMEDGMGGAMMNVNIPEAMKVRVWVKGCKRQTDVGGAMKCQHIRINEGRGGAVCE